MFYLVRVNVNFNSNLLLTNALRLRRAAAGF